MQKEDKKTQKNDNKEIIKNKNKLEKKGKVLGGGGGGQTKR